MQCYGELVLYFLQLIGLKCRNLGKSNIINLKYL